MAGSLEGQLIVIISFTFAILSLFIFIIVFRKFLKDRKKKLVINALTRLLSIQAFLLFLDGIYFCLLYASQYRFISEKYFFLLSSPKFSLLAEFGILILTILLLHFIMEKRIEQFKTKEESLVELEKLNQQLEKRAKEFEASENNMQKKVAELEKFNEIAKRRETKMLELVKKIEKLEAQLTKKKN